MQKPPLGLMPRFIWDEKRMLEIESAIERYLEVRKPIPLDWIEEYVELSKRKRMCEKVSNYD